MAYATSEHAALPDLRRGAVQGGRSPRGAARLLVMGCWFAAAMAAVAIVSPRRAEARGGHPHFHDGGTLSWWSDIHAACHAAKLEGRLVFIEVGKPACTNCRTLVSNILPAAGLRERLAKIAVGLAIDARFLDERAQRIFERNLPASELRVLPWAGFLDERGRFIVGWAGAISAGGYEAHLAKAEAFHAAHQAQLRAANEQPNSGESSSPPATTRAPEVSRSPDAARRPAPDERIVLFRVDADEGGCSGGQCAAPPLSPPSANGKPGSGRSARDLVADAEPLPPPAIRPRDPNAAPAPLAAPQAIDEPVLYGSPDGDISANRVAIAPARDPYEHIAQAWPGESAVSGSSSADDERGTPTSTSALADATPPAPANLAAPTLVAWADVELAFALEDALAKRLVAARERIDHVLARLPDQAISEDARRGLAALKDLGELGAMTATSPIRAHLMERARAEYRGSRWARCFS